MTIFAVVCAGIFPGVHIGRPWLPYYMFPIPIRWTCGRSLGAPSSGDVFAVSTYATRVDLVFGTWA